MRRSTAKVKKFAGAIGLALSLPLSFAAAAAGDLHAPAQTSSLAQLAESSSVLDAWRDYALADLKPNFSWAEDRPAALTPPSLFDRGNAHFAPAASHFTGRPVDQSTIQVAYLKSKVADTPLFVAAAGSILLQDYTPGLQRYVVAPSVSHRWGDHSAISFSAIFAYQRFAGLGLGLDSIPIQGSAEYVTTPLSSRGNVGSYGKRDARGFQQRLDR